MGSEQLIISLHFLSLLLLELFLNSLSQPYSLEEQEQMLSCLSIDSPLMSDASEKVNKQIPAVVAVWL